LKFGDSLYRCKQLKRAALGRMMKVIKKNASSFAYLDEVRQHMARLPSIDPNTRTILICGYPNVGKTSFINKITRVDGEVQPYPFTTKSLFVGHMDYRYLRWQVIDTPGILDRPLDEHNTIEMQSITALAHLRATILYFIDISEQCGYTIDQQVKLCESIKPLFANKPVVIVMTKIDIIKPDDLKTEDKERIKSVSQGENVILLPMSSITEEGIVAVKQSACEALLQHRTQIKLRGKHIQEVANRVHLAIPVPRDDKERLPVTPPQVEDREVARQRQEEWERQQELYLNFDPDYKGIDWRERYDLENPEWKLDAIPEILDGKNVIDFWSPEIGERMEQLEREEQARVRREMMEMEKVQEMIGPLSEQQMAKVRRIREKRALMVIQSRAKKTTGDPPMPTKFGTDTSKDLSAFQKHLDSLGLDGKEVVTRIRARSKSRPRSESRERSVSASRVGRKRTRDELESRGFSMSRGSVRSFKDEKQKSLAERLAKRARKELAQDGRLGESDHHIFDLKPKHLFSGKRGIGSTDRR